MFLISHRGNLTGYGGPNWENHPDYIKNAMNMGFNVEIDVWYVDGEFYLGHDFPIYHIDSKFLENKNLWCHAKDISSLRQMIVNKKITCFYHKNDDYTLTSNGFIWTYPGMDLTDKSIVVLPELSSYSDSQIKTCAGICSDKIHFYL
jgi:hypothetical protein